MRIGIDILVLQSVAKQRGVGRYLQALLRGLKEHRADEYFLLYNKRIPLPSEIHKFVDAGMNLIGLEFSWSQDQNSSYTSTSLSSRRLNSDDIRCLSDYGLNVIHLTSPMEYSFTASKEILGIPIVATVYDFIPLLFPEHYLLEEDAKQSYIEGLKWLLEADRWICISQSTANDLTGILQAQVEQIDVIYLGPGDYLVPPSVPNRALKAKNFGRDKPYILAVTSIHWCKNLYNLIAAYSQIPELLRQETQLVIVCGLSKHHEYWFREWAAAHQIKDSEIVFSGEVADNRLSALYQNAFMLVHPSVYEGFGLPVLEAMYCGVPVVTSDTSSMAEIANGAAKLVDPLSVSSIAQAMTALLVNESERKGLIEKGLGRASAFSWDDCVTKTIASYHRAGQMVECD